MSKFIVDCYDNCGHYSTAIIWIADLLTIHWLLILTYSVVDILCTHDDLGQSLQGVLSKWVLFYDTSEIRFNVRYFTDIYLDPVKLYRI